MEINPAPVLDFFFWGLEAFSRRDCGLILAGLRQCGSKRQADVILGRFEARHWIQHKGKGRRARFTITAAGAQHRTCLDVARHWNAPWDGKWRLFTYDLPEKRRTERVLLWRALHARKLGLLQRSVWVWPHPVETVLQDVLEATGIPECFCGFDCERLFLCTDLELVSVSWNFARISESHQAYKKIASRCFDSLQSAHDLQQLARVAGQERGAYEHAFLLDPLLPRSLWPMSYEGPALERLHTEFRSLLEGRLRQFVS